LPALKKTLTSALSAAVIAAGLAVGTATSASAHTCPSAQSPVAPGGKASWQLACTSKGLKIFGWVEDTRADGLCATITAVSEDGVGRIDMKEACGYRVRTNFDIFFAGNRAAKVTLRILDTDG
jgi:hypothetical protein